MPPPPDALTFSMRLTRKDVLVYLALATARRMGFVGGVSLVIGGVSAVWMEQGATWSDRVEAFALVTGGVLALVLLTSAAVALVRVARLDREGIVLEENRVRVDDDGVEVTGSASAGRIGWSRFVEVKATRRLVLLRLAGWPATHVILTRRDLPDGGVECVTSLFRRSRSGPGG